MLNAHNGTNKTETQTPVSLGYLPDSIKTIISDKKFIIYHYGHHGIKWCLIYEDRDSYVITIGTTRQENIDMNSGIDTLKLLNSYRDLICWGIDTLPETTRAMVPIYQKEWSPFYSSLSVYNTPSVCLFNSDNAIGFEGTDEIDVNNNFKDLCYLMWWLSDPNIRKYLPGFEQFYSKVFRASGPYQIIGSQNADVSILGAIS